MIFIITITIKKYPLGYRVYLYSKKNDIAKYPKLNNGYYNKNFSEQEIFFLFFKDLSLETSLKNIITIIKIAFCNFKLRIINKVVIYEKIYNCLFILRLFNFPFLPKKFNS